MHKKIIIVTENKKAFEEQLRKAGVNIEEIEITLATDISETSHAIKYHEPWHVIFDDKIEPRLLHDLIHEANLVLKKMKKRYKPELLLYNWLPPGIRASVTAPELIALAKKLSSN